jgi:fluoroquinolone transport system permease protein
MPVVISVGLTLLVLPLSGLVSLRIPVLLAVAVSAAPMAPLFALFLAAFAANKVQGFAIQKMIGIVFLPPLIAYFTPAPWEWLFGLVPTYWPAKVLWLALADDGRMWIFLVVGLLAQLLFLWLLLGRYNRVMRIQFGPVS